MHNNSSLREMTKTANDYAGIFIWQTILLLIICIFLLAGSMWLAAIDVISVWLAALVNYLALYWLYSVLHEAVHGNIGGSIRGDSFVDRWCGRIAGFFLMIPYSAHKTIHLTHHKHTNDPEHDPDHYTAGKTPLSILYRCFTISISYIQFCRRHSEKPRMRNAYWMSILAFVQIGIILAIMGWQWGWQLPVIGYLLPSILTVATLGFLFDWIVHTPHSNTARFKNTSVFEGQISWVDRAYTWVTLQQNYHGIHHAYPRIPFVKYRTYYKRYKAELAKKGMPIIEY